MPTTISLERADTADARTLIAELEAELEPFYPRESRHGYSVEKLLAESVTFFLVRADDTPAGCGGLKLFGTEYGEVKRMFRVVDAGRAAAPLADGRHSSGGPAGKLRPAEMQHEPDNQIVDHGHRAWGVTAFQVTPILPQRFVAPIMQAVFNAPVTAVQRQEPSRAGLVGW